MCGLTDQQFNQIVKLGGKIDRLRFKVRDENEQRDYLVLTRRLAFLHKQLVKRAACKCGA